MTGNTHNEITGDVFFSTVIQGRDLQIQLPPSVTPALSGLPAGSPTFTGREKELRSLLTALEPRSGASSPDTVLVTAVGGLAGVGKTELAIHAARAALNQGWFPGGVLFVDLFGYDPERRHSPAQSLDGLLRALGVPGERIPADLQDRARLYTSVLTTYAQQGRRVLVVVDNGSSAEQVKFLLPTDGINTALVTSRHTLGMLGARLLTLDVLSQDQAVQLLGQSLRVARSGDARVTDHPEDAAVIAELCGGLPLALHIVVALLADDPARPIASMADDLSAARLNEMQYADTAVRSAFELSYRRLGSEEARMFRLISVNPGSDISTESAAELTAMAQAPARRLLETLARAHLIEPGGHYGRWRMHDLVRLYAEELGQDHANADRQTQALARLLQYFLTTSAHAIKHLILANIDFAGNRFANQAVALAWLDAEYPNLMSAVHATTNSDEDTHLAFCQKLPLTLGPYLDWRLRFNDWAILTDLSVGASRRLGDLRLEGQALANLGAALVQLERFDEAIPACRDATQLLRDTGDQFEGWALINLCVALRRVGHPDKALTLGRDAVRICRDIGYRRGEAQAISNLAGTLQYMGRYEEAIREGRRALDIQCEIGDTLGQAITLSNISNAMRGLGRFEDALAPAEQVPQLYHDLGDPINESETLTRLADLLTKMGRPVEAIAVCQKAERLSRDVGDRLGESQAMFYASKALRAAGHPGEAGSAFESSLDVFREIGDWERQTEARKQLNRPR